MQVTPPDSSTKDFDLTWKCRRLDAHTAHPAEVFQQSTTNEIQSMASICRPAAAKHSDLTKQSIPKVQIQRPDSLRINIAAAAAASSSTHSFSFLQWRHSTVFSNHRCCNSRGCNHCGGDYRVCPCHTPELWAHKPPCCSLQRDRCNVDLPHAADNATQVHHTRKCRVNGGAPSMNATASSAMQVQQV